MTLNLLGDQSVPSIAAMMALANMVVVGGRVWNIAGESGDGLKKIGPGHDADKLISAHDGQALHVVLLDNPDNIFERGIFCNGDRIRCHDLLHLAAPFTHIFRCGLTFSHQKL